MIYLQNRELILMNILVYIPIQFGNVKNIWMKPCFLKNYFTVKEENKIIHFIDNLYQDLCNGKKYLNIPLKQEYIHHLEIIYSKIQELDTYKKESIKDEARRMRLKTILII